MLEELKQQVCEVNLQLVAAGLVIRTWGNASGLDRARGLVVIKPSGVPYEQMTPAQMVVVALESGKVLEGALNPSTDTPTHLVLYRAFPNIGAVIHTHSKFATMWAQAGRELPCFGTTHADLCYGPVPVTRPLTRQEIEADYEWHTGKVIVERFHLGRLDANQVPAVLLEGHAPFVWGATTAQALANAIALEVVAELALHTLALQPLAQPISQALLDKHFLRKHGTQAYYGQKT